MSKSIAQKVMSHQKRLEDLKRQRAALQSQEDQLHQEIASQMSTLLMRLGVLSLPQDILVGGLLHVMKMVNTKDPQVGDWQRAGATFLFPKSASSKKGSSPQEPLAIAS